MSPAIDNMRKNWLTILLSFLLSFVGGLIMFAATKKDVNDKELKAEINAKANYGYVSENFERIDIIMKNFADFNYVDQQISAHEKQDAARYQGIESMFFIMNERLKAIQDDVRALNSAKK